MKTKKLLSIMLAIATLVTMTAAFGISASAGKAVNSTTFDMKVKRVSACSCSEGRVQSICPDCDPLTRATCATCEGTGVALVDCTQCDGSGTKSWTDTISVTVTGEMKVGSTLTAVNNTSSVPVEFEFYCFDSKGCTTQSNPYTLAAGDVGATLKLYCEATENKWDNDDNLVTLGTVAPSNECRLDLDTSTADIPDTKKLDQNYNLTVENASYTNASKVKLYWEITDINAERTDNKVWDTEELCWKTSSFATEIKQKGKARFTLENYSSVKVDATVSFEATGEFDPTVSFDGDSTVTLDTAAENDTYSKTNVPTGEINVTVTPGDNDFNTANATTAATAYGIYTVTIEEHEEPACIASGTMVTLADGTKKVIDDVTMDDCLLTYNFFTGEIEGNKPMYILKNDNILSSVITLSFSDQSELEICDEQSFFDMDTRDYILISRKNYQAAVGKNIMQIKDGKPETVTITDITLEKRYCTSYELATENAVNFVTNDIVNTPPDYFLPGTYTVGEDLKIDAEQYQKDAAQYGLYTYADFEKYISENTFINGHIADVKIAVGKGLISEEAVFACYDVWTPIIHNVNN